MRPAISLSLLFLFYIASFVQFRSIQSHVWLIYFADPRDLMRFRKTELESSKRIYIPFKKNKKKKKEKK